MGNKKEVEAKQTAGTVLKSEAGEVTIWTGEEILSMKGKFKNLEHVPNLCFFTTNKQTKDPVYVYLHVSKIFKPGGLANMLMKKLEELELVLVAKFEEVREGIRMATTTPKAQTYFRQREFSAAISMGMTPSVCFFSEVMGGKGEMVRSDDTADYGSYNVGGKQETFVVRHQPYVVGKVPKELHGLGLEKLRISDYVQKEKLALYVEVLFNTNFAFISRAQKVGDFVM